ncbi:hypothetical protein SGLAD_v1c02490 [Spiroplasma gladiatoris]|uniref:Uncharacterized protein n=1 Tax=Spiroplasma gladiatoris TaxID=2143 RepID=A0A4P7AI95_9MOLU|nr:hypothetical protein [Spiroplasma gladiatoris]QBQ07448.1 hypothetical protein SGLAD_v1c02490 [Spiroplasma gladiatoris]
MAKFENGIIDFDKNDIENAWLNSPGLVNRDEKDYKMCYICKFHMIKTNFNNAELGSFGWIVDLINLKKLDLNSNNFIAIHPWCIEYKKKTDNRSILKKVKSQLWVFNEN